MSTKLKNPLLAGAAAVGLSLGFGAITWAAPITLNPSAYNTGNGGTANGSGGDFALDSAVGAFNASNGAGTSYQDIDITASSGTSGVAYSGDVVINITGFAGTPIGSGWQLFALVSLTGTGGWGTGSASSTFTAKSVDETIQIYGVNTSGDVKIGSTSQTTSLASGSSGYAAYTFQRPHNNGTAPADNILTAGTSITYDDLTGHNPDGLYTYPEYNVSGTIGPISPNNSAATSTQSACRDGHISSNSPTNTNCILLADGSSTSGNELSLNLANTSAGTESFSLTTLLDPETYADGTDGFFGADPDLILTIDSGNIQNEINPVAISEQDGIATIDSGTGGASSGSDAVVWDLADPVPEPASLSVFGMALIGLGALRRRKRKTA